MKKAFRLYQRDNGVFYIQNNSTREQRSLKTADKDKAKKLLRTWNETRDIAGEMHEILVNISFLSSTFVSGLMKRKGCGSIR